MAQMMCKMGCHRRLCYARLLNRSGFGFVTVFVTHVRQSLSSLQRPEPEKRLFRQLPFSSATSELPQQERLLFRSSTLHALVFPFASRRLSHSVTLHFLNRISNPHLPLVSLHTIPFTSTVQPTASFSYPIQRQQKHVPNPCAYCRGRRLSSPCPFPAFPLTQLAVGSQRYSRTSFHLLHSFRKPTAVHRAALLHAAALRAVLPLLISSSIH